MNRKSLSKKCLCLVLAVLLAAVCIAPATYASASLSHQTQQVPYSRGTANVQVVWVNLSDPNINIRNVIAHNTLRIAAPLNTIAESARTSAYRELAAINAAFFDPAGAGYSGTNVFFGIIENNGTYIKTGGNNVVMGFDANNRVRMGEPGPAIKIYREGAGRFEMP